MRTCWRPSPGMGAPRADPAGRIRTAALLSRHFLTVAINGEFKETAMAAVDLARGTRGSRTGCGAREEQGGGQTRRSPSARARRAAPRAVKPPRARGCRSGARWEKTSPRTRAHARSPPEARGGTRSARRPRRRAEEIAAEPASAAAQQSRTGGRRTASSRRGRAERPRSRPAAPRGARRRRARSRAPPRQADEAEARPRREGLNRLTQLVPGRASALVEKPDSSPLKSAMRALRDVRLALADVPPPLPSRRDYDEVVFCRS